VIKFDTSGRALGLWTFPLGGKEAGALDWVHGLAVDARGDLYLGDIEGQRVQKFRRVDAAPVDSSVEKARSRP
jgi:hypothetical protein